MKSSRKKDKVALIKTLAAVFENFSVGYFGLVFIVPNFLPISGWNEIILLLTNLFLGILFLWIAYKLERRLL